MSTFGLGVRKQTFDHTRVFSWIPETKIHQFWKIRGHEDHRSDSEQLNHGQCDWILALSQPEFALRFQGSVWFCDPNRPGMSENNVSWPQESISTDCTTL